MSLELLVSPSRVRHSSVGALTRQAMNMMVAFYAATFPGIVQDLPEVIQSEKEVIDGTRE